MGNTQRTWVEKNKAAHRHTHLKKGLVGLLNRFICGDLSALVAFRFERNSSLFLTLCDRLHAYLEYFHNLSWDLCELLLLLLPYFFYHIISECCGMIARRVIRYIDIYIYVPMSLWTSVCVCVYVMKYIRFCMYSMSQRFFEVKRGDIALLI